MPTLDELCEPGKVVAIHRDRGVDILCGTYGPMTDDREAPDDDVAHTGLVEITKCGSEVIQR
jgi:hypothetical protein